MKFDLLDSIVEQTPDRIVAIKRVEPSDDYLADHFPSFPVLPGVLMVETMVQAARLMLADRSNSRLVVGEIKALKFGSFVRPNEALQVEVTLIKALDDDSYTCRGTGRVLRQDSAIASETAVAGRFTMRPVRTEIIAKGQDQSGAN